MIILYTVDSAIAIIPEPTPVERCHLQVDKDIWQNFCHTMDIIIIYFFYSSLF